MPTVLTPHITPQTHPLRFLLYLEWVLIGLVIVSELALIRLRLPHDPKLNLLGLGLFLLMGLRLPQRSPVKETYTLLAGGLTLLLSWMGGLRLFQLLYVVMVTRNCLMFAGWQRSLITVIAWVLCGWTQWQRLQYFALFRRAAFVERVGALWLSFVLLMGLVFLFLQLLVTAVLQERQSREQLAVTNAQLREYALRIEEMATLQERNRIARDIHDSLGHSLTVFNLHLAAALQLLDSDPDEAKQLLTEAKQLGSIALRDVRQSVATLRSNPLQGQSLEEAIATLIDDFQRSTGVTPNFRYRVNLPLPDQLETAVYRIVQEALTNICKYATATQVNLWIQTDLSIPTNPTLHLRIRDNGKGFVATQTTSGFGLQGMQERTLALSGQFNLVTAPGKGCQIQTIFPICLCSEPHQQ